MPERSATYLLGCSRQSSEQPGVLTDVIAHAITFAVNLAFH